jgi:phytoene desaturase
VNVTQKHVVVVGAGIGGLCSAMVMAHRGLKVTVVERLDRVGGRNAAIRLGDFTFDMGPTFLMMAFALKEMFRESGRRLEDYMELVRLEPMYQLVLGGAAMPFGTDHEATKAVIGKRFPGREGGLDRFMRKERVKFARLFPCLQKPYSHWSSLLQPVLLRAIPHLDLRRTVMERMVEYFGDEELGLAFSFQSKYLGMSPWTCPGPFTMLSYIEHEYGVYHVAGGLSEISASMARAVREEGGEVVLGSPVARVLTEGRRAVGVELDGGQVVRADDVVLNADFGYCMSELVDPGLLKRWHPDRLREKPFSCSTFMLYLGLDTLYDLPHHSIFFAQDYGANLDDIFVRRCLSDDMSFYVRNASVTDPSLAPAGQSAVYVLVPVPNNKSGIDWGSERRPYRGLVLDRLEAAAGMSGIRDHIVEEKVITPADWEREHNVYLGATFNLAHVLSQMMYFRPRNRFEELEHCYLVGGGTHPGSGVPTILESGRITANLICGAYGVPFSPPRSLAEMCGEFA